MLSAIFDNLIIDCVFPVSVDTVVFGEGIGRIDIQSYQILTETFYLR